MTQDCSHSPSTADAGRRLPKGISVTGTGTKQVPGKEEVPWGYIYVRDRNVFSFEEEMARYNDENPAEAHECFVHRTVVYKQKDGNGGVKVQTRATLGGLVFLRGTTLSLQQFLKNCYPQYHLVYDRSRGLPASISDRVMRPFMAALRDGKKQVTFLREPFEKFARDHVKLRVLTGLFKGYEGYIVRIDRDRQLVFDFGGCAVAIRGLHKEQFEEVKE